MKFVCDSMVGRLAKWLRILGFDCLYHRGGNKAELLRLSLGEDRIVLTRTRSFAEAHPERSCLIESERFETQLAEVISAFNLQTETNLFSRCSVCNTLLRPVTKSAAKGEVPFFVHQNHDRFAYCEVCRKHYWEGTYHKIMQERIARLMECAGK